MGTMASQITSLIIVYATVYSGPDKKLSPASLVIMTGEFPAQMAINAENVFIWWRHHDCYLIISKLHIGVIVNVSTKTKMSVNM